MLGFVYYKVIRFAVDKIHRRCRLFLIFTLVCLLMKCLYPFLRQSQCITLVCIAIFSTISFAQEAVNSDNSETSSTMQTSNCPDNFYDIPVPKTGKLCQMFATDLPASMVFHVPQDVQSTVEYYQNSSQFNSATKIKERFLIQSIDENATVIVSTDGAGSQVDILIKSYP